MREIAFHLSFFFPLSFDFVYFWLQVTALGRLQEARKISIECKGTGKSKNFLPLMRAGIRILSLN